MSIPRSVAEVLREHVVLEVEAIDRMYLNVYVPHLQSVGAVVGYLRVHRGQRFASTTAVTPMTEAFVRNIDQFINHESVDLVAFQKWQRKDDVTQKYLRRFTQCEGVLYALTEEGVGRVIAELRTMFDWVICDSPAGIERGATLAMRFADAAVIVANSEVSSVRDSDRIIGLLDSKTVKVEKGERMEKHLLITRFDSARAARGEMLPVEDVLEILSVPLLGIIPESEAVLRASNLGTPVTICSGDSAPARAYTAAARRLAGENIEMTIPTERRGFFKLFGRRAA